MRFITITLVFLTLGFTSINAQFVKQKKWKIGLNRFNSGVNYVYETQRKDAEDSEAATKNIKKSSSGSISATDFMIEYIVGGRFGLELDFNLTPGIRNFTFTENAGGNTKIGDIVETIKSSALYGANFYFNDHSSDGLKYYLGLLTGSFTATHTYSNGGDRDDDQEDTLTSFKSSMNSVKQVPAQIIKFGIDWILESVGFRFQLLTIQAETKTTQELGKTGLDQKQSETITLSGGATIGVFAHF